MRCIRFGFIRRFKASNEALQLLQSCTLDPDGKITFTLPLINAASHQTNRIPVLDARHARQRLRCAPDPPPTAAITASPTAPLHEAAAPARPGGAGDGGGGGIGGAGNATRFELARVQLKGVPSRCPPFALPTPSPHTSIG